MKPSALALLWPIVPPVIVMMALELYLLSGEVLYAHGPSMLLLLTTVCWGGLALLWELVAVPLAVRALLRKPSVRSSYNLVAVVAAVAYVIGVFAYAWFSWHGHQLTK
ncbi:hypothetical protein [Aquabacterium humicola]|uniref:hypothetical protein n=1 Tax=Aquabacterium humicola TaxID=3237377 RepID=UPI0025439BBA|nr:hypothetical protein [Rubrivivax pictus]